MELLEKYKSSITQDARVTLSNKFLLSEMEINIFYLLVSQIRQDDDDLKEYVINLKDLELLTGRTQKKGTLLKVCEKLKKQTIVLKDVVSVTDGKEYEFIVENLIGAIKKPKNKQEIRTTISPDVRQFYINLKKHYNKFQLKNLLQLKGRHSKRLYMILCAFQDTGWYYASIDELLNIFASKVGEDGQIEVKKYTAGSLKKHILGKAKEEIEDVTELRFEIEEKKSGRKVVGYKFNIISVDSPKFLKEYQQNPVFIRLVEECSLSIHQAKVVVDGIDTEMINMLLYQIQLARTNKQIKGNIGGYTITILKRSYPFLEI
ncbi:replication initiation protein [Microscilla marina]|uniref:Initiator RepB protein n=1 Tax=Microscilla marina ATCC 23134 TaxID=313606 RepID=A1ZVZ5_MICM2|nr:replication initiation protein [Microscilla marina]EAY25477.1 initiator RepB protein [Microscilla marina ATCC 23134]